MACHTIDNKVTNMNDENNLQSPSMLNQTSYETPPTTTSPPNATNNQQTNRTSETSQSTPLSSLGINTDTSEEIQKTPILERL